MKKTTLLCVAMPLFLLAACRKKLAAPVKSDEESVLAILYQQKAAEYRALCLQAYHLAQWEVDSALRSKGPHKPFAVITDLDETALDNSDEEALVLKNDTTATFASLKAWWLESKAKAVPGGVAFFKYCKSKGIDIYYISNRQDTVTVVNATRYNMHKLGFPYTDTTDNSHFLFQDSTSSKEPRRLQVLKKENVIVYLGDNLIDLDKAFDKIKGKYQDPAKRQHEVDSLVDRWGVKYIVFPNAIYGDWESSLYNNVSYKMQVQKDSVRNTLLQLP